MSADSARPPLKVLYIGGYSRSGSTLLLRLLAESPGLAAVGELFDIWNRSYRDDQLCGCGRSFRSCPFWHDVTERAFGLEPDDVLWATYESLRRRVQGYAALDGVAAIPPLWVPAFRSPRYVRAHRAYVQVIGALFRSIVDVSGARVVLESSKVPQFAWLLGEVPGVELHMVHLVRDSRATAFSWTRHKVRPEIAGKEQAMDRHSVVRSALEWDLFNTMLSTHRGPFASYTLVRYEDLVEETPNELRRIARAIGEDLTLDFPGDTIQLGTAHTASGNPSRFTVGPVQIRRDDEWIGGLPDRDRRLVTSLTWPGLWKYGYELGQKRLGGNAITP